MVRPLVYQMAQLAILSAAAIAQQPIGSVGVQDATVAGSLEVTNGRAVLVGNTTVTAKEHTAEIALARGGSVRVCATSGLHVSTGKATTGTQPLMLALDRGAIEVQISATSSDFILTPDLRFAIQSAGPLDLRLRVTRNGDTCVENRGSNAPLLRIGDQFGESSYDLRAGQHVLFEHGSLKEVVDRETSPCGCPPEPVISVADAGVTSATPAVAGSIVAAKHVADEHPFPAAISQGLSPVTPVLASPANAVHADVATTLIYSAAAPPDASGSGPSPGAGGTAGGSLVPTPNASAASSTPDASSAPAASPPVSNSPAIVRAEALPPPASPSAPDLAHRIGRFFKRLFGKG